MSRKNVDRAAELLISIGGVVGHVTLHGCPANLLTDIRRRYAAFCLPNSPAVRRGFTLAVDFRTQAPASDSRSQIPTIRSRENDLAFGRWDFAATLQRPGSDPSQFEGRAECLCTPFAFESLLRVLWSDLLPRQGGALFHACGIHDGEKGVLCPGPSGAGKSTLAQKVDDPDRVLSDEVVALQREPNGRWRISGTPFFGELQRGGTSMRSWPLGGIAFLAKGATASTSPLSPGEAILRALECVLCFANDPETVQRNFVLVIALCADVPTFQVISNAKTPVSELCALWNPHLDQRPQGDKVREIISALRSTLQRHGSFAFSPRGGSMRPWLRSGDALFIESADERDLVAGDVALYWRVGPSPDRDTLVCHRVLGRVASREGARVFAKGDALSRVESFVDGKQAVVLGRVRAIHRGGKTRPVPGRLASLSIMLASLVIGPLIGLVERQ